MDDVTADLLISELDAMEAVDREWKDNDVSDLDAIERAYEGNYVGASALKAIADAATPGPWSHNNGDGYTAFIVEGPEGEPVAKCSFGPYEGSTDAALIAAMRNALPKLLAVVEAAEAHDRHVNEEWDRRAKEQSDE